MKIEKIENAQKCADYLYKKGNVKLLARLAQENNWSLSLEYEEEGGGYWYHLRDAHSNFIMGIWIEDELVFDLKIELKRLERPVGRKAKRNTSVLFGEIKCRISL